MASTSENRATKRRRRGLAVAVALTATGLTAGITVAAASPKPSGSTTNVSFVALSPAHKVLSGATIGAGKTNSPIVLGGSTTVPADATVVNVLVSAKGAAGGALNFYPAGNPSGGSGQFLPLTAGQTVTTTVQENPGQSGELTIANDSSGSTVVTATIVGYSMQVADGAISPADGTAGQVLTNTGTGVAWQTQNYQSALTATTVLHPTGDALQNGAALRAALTSGATQSVYAESGLYDIGSASLTVNPGTQLFGASRDLTVVQAEPGAVITVSGDSRLEGVTFVLAPPLSTGAASITVPSGSVTLKDDNIRAISPNDTQNLTMITVDGELQVDDSQIYSQGGGALTDTIFTPEASNPGAVIIDNGSLIEATDNAAGSTAVAIDTWAGVIARGGNSIIGVGPGGIGIRGQGQAGQSTAAVNVDDSSIFGQAHTIDAGAITSFRIGGSMMEGNATGTGSMTCIYDYTQFYVAVPANCGLS